MQLYKLTVEAAGLDAAECAADHLGEASASPALAVTIFERAAPRFLVEAYYDHAPALEGISAELAGLGVDLGKPTLEKVPDANWVALSQASLPPIRAGRFIVHGAHDRSHFAMRRLGIEIEAGEAFGTGHNATTVLCLQALDMSVRRRGFARILDLGCGSGVLAIAAARAMPDARVLATDNDPIAVAIARDNAKLNRVHGRVQVMTATGLAHGRLRHAQPFDLVLSNLLPGPLIALAPRMRSALATGGVAILSGLLNHQAREVAGTYAAAGFHLQQRRQDAGWTALVLMRGR
jgi:ribosomal protein L11 methyltransferase